MRPGVAAAQLVEHGTVAHHHLRARQVEVEESRKILFDGDPADGQKIQIVR